MQKPFFGRLDQIDRIIEGGPENCDFSRDVEPLLVEFASTKYLYDHLEDPKWFDVLVRAGKFREVPEPLEDPEKGTLTYLLWPESRYLARMAEFVPDRVLELILQMPDTKNIRVHEDLADAALKMPPDLAAKLIPKAKTWLESSFMSLLPDKLGEIMGHLARGGKVEEALGLTRSLLAILPDSQGVSREPQTHIDTWDYEQIIKKYKPDLMKAAEERVLVLFCDLLEDSIRFSQFSTGENKSEDSSFIWRRAVEDHSQNNPHGIRDLLVFAVRDTSETLIEVHGKKILESVEKRPYKIFQRIGLYLRQKWPEVDPEGTARIVADPEMFDDIHLHHEFFHLLRELFGTFPQETQNAYLDQVAQAKGVGESLDIQRNGRQLSQEERERYVRHWKYTKLWPIQEFLDQEWRQLFNEFSNEFKELEHPDFQVYITTSWGSASPKKASDLSSMEISELISYLNKWQPSNDFTGPTREGLKRELTSLITSDPERFATEARRFQVLDPAYIGGLLSGLRPKKKESTFSWEPVLDLCLWVINQHRETPERKDEKDDLDREWAGTRMAIARMLSFAFGPDVAEIPFGLRTTVWEVLKPLTDDPDPTQESEANFGNSDPVTLSINTIRGEAMHTVVRYALWVRRYTEETNGKECSQNFDEMPEVREVLENHLDPSLDPSLAIRSVYGQWFPWLLLLDSDWAAENVARIFPCEESLRNFRDAAWEAYINYCSPYDDVLELLKEEYGRAVELIGTTPSERRKFSDPDKRLAEHLMTYYFRGKLNLDESGGLLNLFYRKASDSLCGYAIEFVGRSLRKAEKDVSSEVLDRLKILWIRRIDIVRSAETSISHAAEISAFGWWFASGKFEDAWAIEQLKEALKQSSRIESDFLVVERLSSLATIFPASVVECLDLIIRSDEKGWHFSGWREQTRTIITAVLQSSDEMARETAEDLINYLGTQGHLDFRNLFR